MKKSKRSPNQFEFSFALEYSKSTRNRQTRKVGNLPSRSAASLPSPVAALGPQTPNFAGSRPTGADHIDM
jgi:hypothetical protein